MSYLDLPRLHFAGTYFANPSTVNNDPSNFPRDAVLTPASAGFDPHGGHYFKILASTVRAATDEGGQPVGEGEDPAVGGSLVSLPEPQWARLVDLDPEQQLATQIYGLRLRLTAGEASLEGTFQRVPSLTYLWFRGTGGDFLSRFSGSFQTVLGDLEWRHTSGSPLLQQLRARSANQLAIKFNVDGYDGDRTSPTSATGRIVGTIGPASAGELDRAARLLVVAPGSPLWHAPFQVDEERRKAVFDLGNSVPVDGAVPGPPPDLGTMEVIVDPAGTPVVLGALDYSRERYETSAGIVELDLTSQTAALVRTRPLAIRIAPPTAPPGALAVSQEEAQEIKAGNLTMTSDPGLEARARTAPAAAAAASPVIALAEHPDGLFVFPSRASFRLESAADEDMETGYATARRAEVTLHARQYGRPVAGLTVGLTLLGTSEAAPVAGLAVPGPQPTDAGGKATFVLTAGVPKGRPHLDGDVYYLGHTLEIPILSMGNATVTALVFGAVTADEDPTWWSDVEPIFRQYARLYPQMRDLIDLSDYATVQRHLQRIAEVFQRPVTDPRYMPVTRDLSDARKRRILEWIRNGAPEGVKPPDVPA